MRFLVTMFLGMTDVKKSCLVSACHSEGAKRLKNLIKKRLHKRRCTSTCNVWRKPNEPCCTETSRKNLHSVEQRFLIKGCVKKTDCLSVSELSVFSNPKIRNLWGYTNTNTRKSSLPKKAFEKQASTFALRIRSRSGV